MHQSKNSVILKKSKKGINSYQMPLYPPIEPDDQRFRLDRTAALQAYLQQEVETRKQLSKKYRRALNTINGISVGSAFVGLSLEVGGLTLLTTGIGALPGIVLSGIGAGAFAIDLACGQIIRKLSRKLEKHCAIQQTAHVKLNSINKLVSTALVDCSISDVEFRLISDEVEKYDQLKESIRSKAHATKDEGILKKQWLRKELETYMRGFSPSASS
jgi:hypothetical protein